MKRCSKCKTNKEILEFHKNRTRKDGLSAECKVCKSIRQKSMSRKARDLANEYGRRYSKSKREFIINYKLDHPCIICGEKEYVCLDFHHLDPSTKLFDIARIPTSIERTKEEIEKCVVLCSNCHKKVHAGILDLPKDKSPG